MVGVYFLHGKQRSHKIRRYAHVQAASGTFLSHKQILCDHSAPLKHRLRFFDATVSPVALFGAGHCTLHQGNLNQMDLTFRKLLRAMVGPPPGIDWSCDWHVLLHSWNDRVQRFTNLFHIKTWSRRCVEHYWKLGGYAVVVCITLYCWFHLSHLRPNGLPTGVQVQSQSQVFVQSRKRTLRIFFFVHLLRPAIRKTFEVIR